MIRTITIIILLFAFSSFVSAQEIVSPCLTIGIKGETKAVQSGETMSFTAIIPEDLQKTALKYKWTVDQGTILEGQGETNIQVDTTGLENTIITATLEVVGLPENCNSSASETNVVNPVVSNYDPPKHGEIPLEQQFVELDNLAIFLYNSPESTALIIISLGKNQTLESGRKYIKILVDKHLKLRKYDLSNFIFGVRKSDKFEVVYHIFPKNVDFPECDDCEIIRASDI